MDGKYTLINFHILVTSFHIATLLRKRRPSESQPILTVSSLASPSNDFYQGLLTAAYISMLSAIGERVAARLRCKLFESIIHQDIEFFDSHKTGELISRFNVKFICSMFHRFLSSIYLFLRYNLDLFISNNHY